MKAWNKGMKHPENQGARHFAWKGENVSYRNLHRWVERFRGKASLCENCGMTELPEGRKRYFQWANISRSYKRDLNDWMQLCCLCHKRYDGKLETVLMDSCLDAAS